MEKLIDSEQRVLDVIGKFAGLKRNPSGSPIDNVSKWLAKAEQALHRKQLFSIDWHFMFLSMGHQLMIEAGADFDRAKMAALLKRKSEMYGDAPIEAWGEIGVIIRIDSKLKRYVNLTANPELNARSDNDESIRDTLWDMVGYCVLGYRLTTRKIATHNPEELERIETQLNTTASPDQTNLDI